MNFKEFFKPDRKKIILFVIIFALMLTFLLPNRIIYVCDFGGNDFGKNCPVPKNTFNPILLYILFTNVNFEIEDLESILYHYVLIEAVISYILSCLIIFIYKKLKTKK